MKEKKQEMNGSGGVSTVLAWLRSYTWYGIRNDMFVRMGIAAVLLCLGLFIPMDKSISLTIMLFSFLICGYDVIYKAFYPLFKEKKLNEELMICVAAALAFAISEGYEGAAVMLIFQAGFVLRTYAAELTRATLRDRVDPYPAPVTVEQEDGTVSLEPEQIQSGDILILHPQERVPVDCEVIEGSCAVDLSAILGINERAQKDPGDHIPAGATLINASLRVRAIGTAADSTFSRSLDMASDDMFGRSTMEEMIHRYSGVYAPFAMGLSLLTALLLLIFSATPTEEAIHRALVLLIIACPTALIIPVPMTYLAGLYRALQQGVLVKGAAVMDAISRAGAVVFDKDDLISTGKYRVVSVKSDRLDPNVLLKVAAHAGAGSSHPLTASIVKAYDGVIDPSFVQSFEEFDNGIVAVVSGTTIQLGSLDFIRAFGVELEDQSDGQHAVYMAVNGLYAGCILLTDIVRDNARFSVMAMESVGCDCIMLSSDNPEKTKSAAASAGVREYTAECTPIDYLTKIQEIKERFPVNSVLYIGHGGEDEATLSAADIGVCVNGLESETALQTGSVVVMNDTVDKLADAIEVARTTKRNTRITLIAILSVKLILLVLALLGVSYQLWFVMLVDVVIGIAGVLYSAYTRKLPKKEEL